MARSNLGLAYSLWAPVFLGSAVLLLSLPVCAVAQDVDREQGVDEAIEEIIVTGSRLRRRDFSAPSPIATLDRELLEFTGQGTLETALNQMPQVTPDFDRTANNPGDGTARINLRGLGAGRTLVMLNGRRLAPSGIGSAVDVNTLPQALIERVPKTHRYHVTDLGFRAALFITRSYNRLLRPGLSVLTPAEPPAPVPLRRAFERVDTVIQRTWDSQQIAA